MTNKTLEQIQEENRKLIILANNPEAKSYEEALEMELGFGCLVQTFTLPFPVQLCFKTKPFSTEGNLWKETGGYWVSIYGKCKNDLGIINCSQIIGKPLTLDRVIISLDQHTECFKPTKDFIPNDENLKGKHVLYFTDHDDKNIFIWDLTKPTLEQQSEQTQREINKLLTNKAT